MAQASVVAASAAEQLRVGAAEFGLDLNPYQIGQLLEYLGLLERWSSSFNLTAVRDVEAMVTTHLLDSLSIAPLIQATGATHWLDAGSGAGFPGIPLAVALPAVRITSVDAVQKKIHFQTQVKGALKLANLAPLHQRVEALTSRLGVDAAMFRAFASLADGLASVAEVLPLGGQVIAMKANIDDAELGAVPPRFIIDAVVPLAVPGLDARRCAVLLTKRTDASLS